MSKRPCGRLSYENATLSAELCFRARHINTRGNGPSGFILQQLTTTSALHSEMHFDHTRDKPPRTNVLWKMKGCDLIEFHS